MDVLNFLYIILGSIVPLAVEFWQFMVDLVVPRTHQSYLFQLIFYLVNMDVYRSLIKRLDSLYLFHFCFLDLGFDFVFERLHEKFNIKE